ncbi:MAG TPA: VTT domain-containing protein [Anaerolineaceae bacterium]|jgi:membrane protein YqaA with SNARE-associated domain|nr:VTT domain-containing protein [Anaerolineaceae bacterium]NMC16831.1 VTT domain-containing protein [Chloroflexota bacterium]HNS06712.1 VTT domain-containing protein [Anaerolineaceae bacterium]HNW13893.1 VTT domain-containing protein [Anaerolineaceae bacterium]HOE03013.1 VTT domain-containing protein [Anaerolineaceae bacterium]
MSKLSGWKLTFVRVLVLLAVITLTIFLILNRDRVQELEALGYPGIFLISLFSNATLILPVPGVLFTSAMGAVFNPYWVALAAGCGAALGELTGYVAGFSGQGIIENKQWYARVTEWMKKFGGLTVLLLAFIPNPIFDIAGMVAGALRMPLWKFLLFSWVGKTGKMLVFALGGAGLLELLT